MCRSDEGVACCRLRCDRRHGGNQPFFGKRSDEIFGSARNLKLANFLWIWEKFGRTYQLLSPTRTQDRHSLRETRRHVTRFFALGRSTAGINF